MSWKNFLPPEFRTQGSTVVIVLFAALAVGLVAAPSTLATGEIYQYIDEHGTLHVTNVPADRRFRKLEREYSHLGPRASRQELEAAIAWYSKKHRLDPALVRAVIKAESDFDPRARSRTGAMGLMQLMPKTAAALNVRDPYNPVENIKGGSRHLRYLLDRFNGKLHLALAAYNAGETPVRLHKKVPPYRETRHYVRKVLRFYRAYQGNSKSSLSAKPSARTP